VDAEEEKKELESEPPHSLGELAVHCQYRLYERSIVNNITTAVNNTVIKGTPLILPVLSRVVTVIEPVGAVKGEDVRSTIEVAFERAKHRIESLQSALIDIITATSNTLSTKLQSAMTNLMSQLNTAIRAATTLRATGANAFDMRLQQLRADLIAVIATVNTSVRSGVVSVGGENGSAILHKVDETADAILHFIQAAAAATPTTASEGIELHRHAKKE